MKQFQRKLAVAGIILLATLAGLAGCAGPAPRIAIDPAAQDLGERPQEHLELTYTVRNDGQAPLKIEEVTTSCGCTKASVESETVAPGQTTPLRVTMDPQQDNLYGNLLRVITIKSNDPAKPLAQVEFKVSIPKPQ